MDPISALGITSTCMTLATNAGTLVLRISVFVSQARSARKDLDAVSRELTSLQLCLSALKDDQQHGTLNLPDAMKVQISQILVNIDLLLNQISDKLIKLSSGKLGRRIQWATTERDEMNNFRSSLESNKTALEIALTIGSISILTQHVQNSTRRDSQIEVLLLKTESISFNTRTINGKLDVLTGMHKDKSRFDRLAQEIENLRTHLTSLVTTSSSTTLNTFKSSSEAYTQSLLRPLQATLPNSEFAALIDLSPQPTSNSPQMANCNCEDIHIARQQELDVHYQKQIAEYESRYQMDMVALQECEEVIVTYQQQWKQKDAENARLQTEITSLKKQIEENAKIIGVLRTSQKEWETRQQAMTAPQQMLGTYVAEPQSRFIPRKNLPNSNARVSETYMSEVVQQQRISNVDDLPKQTQARGPDISKSEEGRAPVEKAETAHCWELIGHSGRVCCMAFSPDGTKIVSGSYDTSVIAWDVATGKQLGKHYVGSSGIHSVAFSPCGIVAAGLDSHDVVLWNALTGEFTHRFRDRTLPRKLSFSPDGSIVVSTGLVMWNVSTGKQIRELGPSGSLKTIRMVCYVAFAPDETTIADGLLDGQVRIWNVFTGTMLKKLHAPEGTIYSMRYSPDSTNIMALCNRRDSIYQEGIIRTWCVASGKQLRNCNFDGRARTECAQFSEDGTRVALTDLRHSVRILDVATGKQIHEVKRDDEYICSVAFSPNGQQIATGLENKSVRIRDFTLYEQAVADLNATPAFLGSFERGHQNGHWVLTPTSCARMVAQTTPNIKQTSSTEGHARSSVLS